MHAPRLAPIAVVALALAGLASTSPAAVAKVFTVTMNGKVEVPRGDPDGRGTARLTTTLSKGRVCYDITLSRVGRVSAGHIHRGAKGKAGAVVVALFAKATRRPKGCVNGVKKSLIRDINLHPGRYYINVHNSAYPAGAVRGQLTG